MDVPVGDHQFADEIEAGGDFAGRPAGEFAVETAHAGGVGDDAVLALDAVFGAPPAELADEIVGDLVGPRLPVAKVAPVLSLEGRVELGHGELVEVHQAGRVIDDEADWEPVRPGEGRAPTGPGGGGRRGPGRGRSPNVRLPSGKRPPPWQRQRPCGGGMCAGWSGGGGGGRVGGAGMAGGRRAWHPWAWAVGSTVRGAGRGERVGTGDAFRGADVGFSSLERRSVGGPGSATPTSND